MRILHIMLVFALLVANYAAAAQAFGGISPCVKSMMAGEKMMDCCKDKSGNPLKCPCGSCDAGASVSPVALPSSVIFHAAPAVAALESPSARALSQLFPPPDFRPPDFLA